MIDPKTLLPDERDVLSRLDHVPMTVDAARAYFDGSFLPEEFDTALDNAQGHVFSDAGDVAYVLIKVTR